MDCTTAQRGRESSTVFIYNKNQPIPCSGENDEYIPNEAKSFKNGDGIGIKKDLRDAPRVLFGRRVGSGHPAGTLHI